MNVVAKLAEKKLIEPPKWLPTNVMYETIMGSMAYGVSSDTSDMDVYAFCVPPKEVIFPHLRGEIVGFGKNHERFNQYQKHHVLMDERNYDISVYNIVDYFNLVMKNNPNMVDSLYTPVNCVTHITEIGRRVRDNRKIFLHRGAWHTFKGYAYSQMAGMQSQTRTGKRAELVEQFGYDVKFAYHVVRLLDEVAQILTQGDIDLQRNKEQLKSIRRGEWTIDDIKNYFRAKEKALEAMYENSTLPWGPDEQKIKQLLLECLEIHYGNLGNCIVNPDEAVVALRNIAEQISKVNHLLG